MVENERDGGEKARDRFLVILAVGLLLFSTVLAASPFAILQLYHDYGTERLYDTQYQYLHPEDEGGGEASGRRHTNQTTGTSPYSNDTINASESLNWEQIPGMEEDYSFTLLYSRLFIEPQIGRELKIDGSESDRSGWNVTLLDLTGDGQEDVVVGAPYNDTADGSVENAGAVRIYFGSNLDPGMNLNPEDADVTIYGASSNDKFGWSVANASDWTGNGVNDLLVGAPGSGEAHVFKGGDWSGVSSVTDADVNLTGDTNDEFGKSVGGGASLTSNSNIFVGAPESKNERGKVYVYEYGSEADKTAQDAKLNITGKHAGDRLGHSLAGATSVSTKSGDNTDLIVGAPYAPESDSTGRAYIFYGSHGYSGNWNLSKTNANVTLDGESTGDRFGWSVFSAGDVKGNGYGDVVVGAPGYSNDQGRGYVYFGNDNMGDGGSSDTAMMETDLGLKSEKSSSHNEDEQFEESKEEERADLSSSHDLEKRNDEKTVQEEADLKSKSGDQIGSSEKKDMKLTDGKSSDTEQILSAGSGWNQWSKSYNRPDTIYEITHDDIDGDGNMEAIFVDADSSGNGYVYIAENTGNNDFEVKWYEDLSIHSEGTQQIATGYLDPDNKKDIIIADGDDGIHWYEYDGSGDDISNSIDPIDTISRSGNDPGAVEIADTDQDGYNETVVAYNDPSSSVDGYDADMEIFESTGVDSWTSLGVASEYQREPKAIRVADLEGDGTQEIAILGGYDYSGFGDYYFDIWECTGEDSYTYKDNFTFSTPGNALYTDDINLDGEDEFLLAHEDGWVDVIDGADSITSLEITSEPLTDIRAGNLNGGSSREFYVSAGGTDNCIYQINHTGDDLSSSSFSTPTNIYNSNGGKSVWALDPCVPDYDEDGKLEILIGEAPDGSTEYGEFFVIENQTNVNGTWLGNVNTDWSTPKKWNDNGITTFNWASGREPDETVDVTIPAQRPNYPLVDEDEYSRYLDVDSGGYLDIASYNLNVTVKTNVSGRVNITGGYLKTNNGSTRSVGLQIYDNGLVDQDGGGLNVYYEGQLYRSGKKYTDMIVEGEYDISNGKAQIEDDLKIKGTGKLTMSGGTIQLWHRSQGNFTFTDGASEYITGGKLKIPNDFTDFSSGTFTPEAGTVEIYCDHDSTYPYGVDSNITLNSGSHFYGLNISKGDTTDYSAVLKSDIAVNGDLNVTEGNLTAGPGKTIDMSGGGSSSFEVYPNGKLIMDGDEANEVLVKGASSARVDWQINGSFEADNYTVDYPDQDGLEFSNPNIISIENCTFDHPSSNGVLLNLTGVESIPSPLYGCVFDNSSGIETAYNVKANDSTQNVQLRNYSGGLASSPSIAAGNEDDPNDKIHWGVKDIEVGVEVVGDCSDDFGSDIEITYQMNGSAQTTYVGESLTTEQTSIWPDYGSDITWQETLVAQSEDRERWQLDHASSNTETALNENKAWIKDYYHQYQLSVNTTGSYLDSDNYTSLYWQNTSSSDTTDIYDSVSPKKEWMNCGAKFNVSTPVEGPESPRDVKYVCDDNESIVSGDSFSHDFLFHAEFPPDVSVDGPSEGAQFGWSVSGGADYASSGYDDFSIGAPGVDSDTGKAYFYYSSGGLEIGDELTAEKADLVREGESQNDRFGHDLSGPGDPLGTGSNSNLISAPYHNADSGRTYLYELADWPTVSLKYESMEKDKLIGEASFETSQGARWYNKTIDTTEDLITLESGDSINMTISVSNQRGNASIELLYGSEKYDSHYEMSLEKDIGEARVESVKTLKKDNDWKETGSWRAEYTKNEEVNITANVTSITENSDNISHAEITMMNANESEIIVQDKNMSDAIAVGDDWKKFNYTFVPSDESMSPGIYKAVVKAVDTNGDTDEILGETNSKVVWFRVVEA